MDDLPVEEAEWLDSVLSLLARFSDDNASRAHLRACERKLSKTQKDQLTRLRFVLNHPGLDEGDALFFMSGIFKSGTTWLGLLLNAHPGLVCGPEEIHAFSAQVTDLYLGKPVTALPPSEAKVWQEKLLDSRRAALIWKVLSTSGKPSAKRLGGRGPVANLSSLIAAFPRIRIPVIIRDGRDVAVSAAFFHGNYYNQGYERFFMDEQRTMLNPAYVQGWAWQFQDYYRMAFKVAAEFPQCVRIIRYEELLERPALIMREVYRFLDVADDLGTVEACVQKCSFETVTGGRKRGDADSNSFFRKGIAGDWRNYFTEECVATFKRTAGEFLLESGYETNDNWSVGR